MAYGARLESGLGWQPSRVRIPHPPPNLCQTSARASHPAAGRVHPVRRKRRPRPREGAGKGGHRRRGRASTAGRDLPQMSEQRDPIQRQVLPIPGRPPDAA